MSIFSRESHVREKTGFTRQTEKVNRFHERKPVSRDRERK